MQVNRRTLAVCYFYVIRSSSSIFGGLNKQLQHETQDRTRFSLPSAGGLHPPASTRFNFAPRPPPTIFQ